MIRLHWETTRRRKKLGHYDLLPPYRLCYVYSDFSLDQLLAWGIQHGFLGKHLRNRPLPHFLVWDRRRDSACQTGFGVALADDATWKRDIAAWRRTARVAKQFALAVD